MATLEQRALELFLPNDIFHWFDIIDSQADADNIQLTLQEKDIPPLPDIGKGKKVEPKGFTNITITDFPARGKRVLITFRRRYWKVEGQDEYLKRDIQLCFPGTQLEKEFAAFLKDGSRIPSSLAGFYRRVSQAPTQGV